MNTWASVTQRGGDRAISPYDYIKYGSSTLSEKVRCSIRQTRVLAGVAFNESSHFKIWWIPRGLKIFGSLKMYVSCWELNYYQNGIFFIQAWIGLEARGKLFIRSMISSRGGMIPRAAMRVKRASKGCLHGSTILGDKTKNLIMYYSVL